MNDSARLRSLAPVLAARAKIVRAMRRFFEERDFLEVDTPVRIPAPAPEVHLDAEPSGGWFLRASPELQMKRLLAAGYPRIFQIGPCFRRGEMGRRHHPEFTMIEWYRAGADYTDILVDTKALILFLAAEVLGKDELVYQGQRVDLGPDWERVTVSQAFLQFAGWDPVAHFDADRFDLDLVNHVEPGLPKDRPVILTDYPAEAAALARRCAEPPRAAERWELYIAGIELANAYSELNDAAEQSARFERWASERAALGKDAYPPDEDFLEALKNGMPKAGGIALGLDRLVMLFTDSASLDPVLPFR